jgi:transposase
VPETLSVVELCEQLAQRDELIEALSAELGAARVRIAELEARLGQTSKNSSKPPSSDGLAKPAPKSLRKRSARKPGGQAGHPGSTLAPVAVPDEVIAHEPGCCRGCGDDLGGAVEVGREHRQVFDIPPISVRVTEHQLIARRCCCGTTTRAEAPEGVTAPVQYGPGITAIIVYLYVGQFLSKKRTAAALAELFGTPVSEGTVATMTTRAATRLGGFVEWVRANLAAAEVVNFDETPVAGRGSAAVGALRVDREVQSDLRARPAWHQGDGRRRGAARVRRGRCTRRVGAL